MEASQQARKQQAPLDFNHMLIQRQEDAATASLRDQFYALKSAHQRLCSILVKSGNRPIMAISDLDVSMGCCQNTPAKYACLSTAKDPRHLQMLQNLKGVGSSGADPSFQVLGPAHPTVFSAPGATLSVLLPATHEIATTPPPLLSALTIRSANGRVSRHSSAGGDIGPGIPPATASTPATEAATTATQWPRAPNPSRVLDQMESLREHLQRYSHLSELLSSAVSGVVHPNAIDGQVIASAKRQAISTAALDSGAPGGYTAAAASTCKVDISALMRDWVDSLEAILPHFQTLSGRIKGGVLHSGLNPSTEWGQCQQTADEFWQMLAHPAGNSVKPLTQQVTGLSPSHSR